MNKTFKTNCTEKYDDWLAMEGINNETEAGNLKAPPGKEIVKWILVEWAALPSEMIKELFIHCALSLPTEGSLDHHIHCFKDGQPCFQGREVLHSQLLIQNKTHLKLLSLTLKKPMNPVSCLIKMKMTSTLMFCVKFVDLFIFRNRKKE